MRDWLCPINRRWNLGALLGTLARDYPRGDCAAASRHFVLIEYVMLRGINDTLEDAHRSVLHHATFSAETLGFRHATDRCALAVKTANQNDAFEAMHDWMDRT